jgi:uncharacterized protein (DUF2164 family)
MPVGGGELCDECGDFQPHAGSFACLAYHVARKSDFKTYARATSLMPHQSPMRIRLSPERRAGLLRAIKQYFSAEFDDPLSDFRAEGLLEFFVRELGPPVYNQGVRDASSFMQGALADIEGEVYESDPS